MRGQEHLEYEGVSHRPGARVPAFPSALRGGFLLPGSRIASAVPFFLDV
jgi:hypothetical protein